MVKRNAKGQFAKTKRKSVTSNKKPKQKRVKAPTRKTATSKPATRKSAANKRVVKKNPSNSYFIVAVISSDRVGGGKTLYYDGFKKFTSSKSEAAYFRKSRAEALARSIARSGFSSHVDHIKVMKE